MAYAQRRKAEGATAAAIAEELGVSQPTVAVVEERGRGVTAVSNWTPRRA